MKNIHTILILVVLIVQCVILSSSAYGQCTAQVLNLSGTSQVGCTQVTVTPSGMVSSVPLSLCNGTTAPYWIGCDGIGPCDQMGSYTFVFNPPVASLELNFSGLDNTVNAVEETFIEIDGAFSPFPAPGTINTCEPPAMLTPGGTLMGCAGCGGSGMNGLIIDGPITTLTVIDMPIIGIPNGVAFALYICPICCATDAGMLTSAPLQRCPNQSAGVPPATQFFLEPDDMLQYILFSDPADTLGSIVAVSNTPVFNFNPATMQTGVEYYIAAIAGNNLNGNVDLDDPCVDFSNGIKVIWRPYPTVAFTIPESELCDGTCQTVTANFTGTPPFNLQYQTDLSGVITQVFADFTGSFQVCIPKGTAPGGFVIQAVSLTDAFCTCP